MLSVPVAVADNSVFLFVFDTSVLRESANRFIITNFFVKTVCYSIIRKSYNGRSIIYSLS